MLIAYKTWWIEITTDGMGFGAERDQFRLVIRSDCRSQPRSLRLVAYSYCVKITSKRSCEHHGYPSNKNLQREIHTYTRACAFSFPDLLPFFSQAITIPRSLPLIGRMNDHEKQEIKHWILFIHSISLVLPVIESRSTSHHPEHFRNGYWAPHKNSDMDVAGG